MKHALRKYLAPCGSALFMVVSTMAALVVLVTAMYMSVLSSGEVQYAVFDQEQAYVSSTSIADVMKGYICDRKNATSAFVTKVLDLKEGESVSTNGNDFASLSSTGTKDDTILGGYTVDVTRLQNEDISGTTWYVYDIAVTVSENDIVETTHTFIRTKDPETPDPDPIDRFFTATGYVPNDVVVGNGEYTSNMYFDSEYTMITDINPGAGAKNDDLRIKAGIICAGSAVINREKVLVECTDTTEWYFGNNLTIKGSQPSSIDLKGTNGNVANPEHGMIVVGGDLIWKDGNWPSIGASGKFTDVYVLGDCYLAKMNIHGNLYVKGNLYFMTGDDNKVEGNLYVNGTCGGYPGVSNGHINKTPQKWSDMVDTDDTYTADEIAKRLTAKIGASVYPRWIVDTSNFEVDRSNKVKVTNINFKNDTGGADDNYVYTIDKDVLLGKITSTGNQVSSLTIIIDTGNAGDIRTIRLKNNDGDQFSWNPSTVVHGYVNVLTVGEGTLVIDVPEGVRYQATDQEFFGHMGWFFLLGGTHTTKNGHDYYDRTGLQIANKYSIDAVLNAVIHETHFDGSKNSCTSCTYSEETNADGEKVYKCSDPNHNAEFKAMPEGCACAGFIDPARVDSYAASKGIDMTYNGVDIIPNVNIYVESCHESADIQFGMDASRKYIQNNLFFGYVYAPYMTYVDIGSGGGVKIVGGLIVSDYVISGFYQYVYCRPDRSLEDVVGADWEPLTPTASRIWRHYGV